jgi:Dolichyl-phosphate-mannose-protein mannosyltransferase
MRGSRGRRAAHRHALGASGLVVFAVAFVVRAWWAIRVQRPIDGVWSDMGGYVLRAELLLSGQMPAEPRMLVMWPWGTHALVAGEIALFGRRSILGIGLCHAAVGALAAPCAAALTARFTRSRAAALVGGLAVALWHPHVVYSGFFSSEIWFTSTTLLATVFLVRHSEEGRGALAAGVFLAAAFVVRPQVLLTTLLVALVLVLARLGGKRLVPLSRGAIAALLVPLAFAVVVSSVRFHRLTGRFGLIAANESVQRLFGATDVAKVEATWTAPNGDRWTWWFNPSTKGIATPATTERFEGFVSDREILARIQERRLAGVSAGARLRRMVDNVLLLAVRNVPWPEDEIKLRWRQKLQRGYARALLVILGLALLGLGSLRRHPVAGVLVTAQLATIAIVGALYLGEARYRVPYDPFLLVLAVSGTWRVHSTIVRMSDGDGKRERRSTPAWRIRGSSWW